MDPPPNAPRKSGLQLYDEIVRPSLNPSLTLATSLILRGFGLPQIPGDLPLSTWPQLIEIDLAGNRLTELPQAFGSFQHARRLRLSDNLFTTLPPCLARLPSLEELLVDGNRLAHLPESWALPQSQPSSLDLDLPVHLPPSACSDGPSEDHAPGRACPIPPSTRRLDLARNRLRTIPLPLLMALTALESLNLAGNPLLSIPAETAAYMRSAGLRVRHPSITVSGADADVANVSVNANGDCDGGDGFAVVVGRGNPEARLSWVEPGEIRRFVAGSEKKLWPLHLSLPAFLLCCYELNGTEQVNPSLFDASLENANSTLNDGTVSTTQKSRIEKGNTFCFRFVVLCIAVAVAFVVIYFAVTYIA